MRKRKIVITFLAFVMTIFLMSLRCDDYNPLVSRDTQRINNSESVFGKVCKCPEPEK